MKSKTKTVKKAQAAVSAPDHHLLCLLGYIDGIEQGTHEPHKAAVRAIESADAILTHHQPFDGGLGKPDPVSSVFALTLAKGIDEDTRALIRKMQTYKPDVVIETNGEKAFGASVCLISNGVMLGAALMYRLLRGGMR